MISVSCIESNYRQTQREVSLHLHFLTLISVLNVTSPKTKIFTVIASEFFLNW